MFALYEFGRLNINKHLTSAKLHKFQQIDQRKKSNSAPKFRLWNVNFGMWLSTCLEIVFQEQSYSSLYSGRSLAWDHFRGDIEDPCGVIADFCVVIANFCGVIADPCGVAAIPEAIVGRAVGDADRCATH